MSGTREFKPENLTYGSDNEESRERLRELILYIIELSHDDPRFGVTKLNKILYFCDFTAFGKFGKPITGISYEKYPYGPVPAGVENTRGQMVRDDDIFLPPEKYGALGIQHFVALRPANLNLFSGPEVSLIDGIVLALSGATGSQLRDISHGKAWQSVGDFERIPYELAFISDEPPSEEAIARAHELVELGELED